MNPKTLKSLAWRWGPALMMMTAIFIASSIPKEEMPTFGFWDLLVKKGGHMVGYALLAVAYLHALARKSGGQRANLAQVVWAILLAGLYGATDEFGFKSVENVVHVHDLHATILHQLGFDHEKFTYRYAGRDFRLSDVYGKVVKEILA